MTARASATLVDRCAVGRVRGQGERLDHLGGEDFGERRGVLHTTVMFPGGGDATASP